MLQYDPYHPHLGYTLAVTCLGWVIVSFYAWRSLTHFPRARTLLYSVMIALPIYAEAMSFIIYLVRPAPDTPVGAFLTHIHAEVIQHFPIDNFLSPFVSNVILALLTTLVIISFGRFIYGSIQLRQCLVGAVELSDTGLQIIVAELQAIVVRHRLPLPRIMLVHSPVPSAFTAGLLRPSIYISDGLVHLLTQDELLAVLCHELAHVSRRDTLWNSLVRLLRDLAWYMPFSHMSWKRMLNSQDEECDYLAAKITDQPLTVARALVKVASAQQMNNHLSLTVITPFAAHNSELQSRVEGLVRWHTQGTSITHLPRTFYVLFTILLLLPVLPALLGS